MSKETLTILLVGTGLALVGTVAYHFYVQKNQGVYVPPSFQPNYGYGAGNTTGLQGNMPWYNSQGVTQFSHDLFGFLGGVF